MRRNIKPLLVQAHADVVVARSEQVHEEIVAENSRELRRKRRGLFLTKRIPGRRSSQTMGGVEVLIGTTQLRAEERSACYKADKDLKKLTELEVKSECKTPTNSPDRSEYARLQREDRGSEISIRKARPGNDLLRAFHCLERILSVLELPADRYQGTSHDDIRHTSGLPMGVVHQEAGG